MARFKDFMSYGHHIEIISGAYKKYSPWHLKEIDFDAVNIFLARENHIRKPYLFVRFDDKDIYRLKNPLAEDAFLRNIDTLLMEKSVGLYGETSCAMKKFEWGLESNFEKIETIAETKARLGIK